MEKILKFNTWTMCNLAFMLEILHNLDHLYKKEFTFLAATMNGFS